jgi:hypothetical protein
MFTDADFIADSTYALVLSRAAQYVALGKAAR